MKTIFKIKDKTGRSISLSEERWKHIITKHPEMENKLEKIKQVLIKPDLIIPHKFDNTKRNYCVYYKDKKRYLLVAVKYLNGEGYVTTSFMVRNIKKR